MNTGTVLDDKLCDDFIITSIKTDIVDLPTKRVHVHSVFEMKCQTYLIITIETSHGLIGYGEAATAGGPWWSGDSIETIKVIIDNHFKPYLIGKSPLHINKHKDAFNKIAARNPFAKAAVEMALLDLAGKSFAVSVSSLFGGPRRTEFEICWPLGTGDAAQEVEESIEMINQGLARSFKVKMGKLPPKKDMERLSSIARSLQGKAEVSVDLNGSWDEVTFARMSPEFSDLGICFVEQPTVTRSANGSPNYTKTSLTPVMADEGVYGPDDAVRLARNGNANAVSIKLMKAGGFAEALVISEICAATGMSCFGGCFLEGGLGTLANMQFGSVAKELSLGCEWIGPLLLEDDVCETPLRFEDFKIHLPENAVGMGADINPQKIAEYRRD